MNEEVLRCSDFSQQYSIEVELAYLIKLLKGSSINWLQTKLILFRKYFILTDNLNLRVALHSIGVVKWGMKNTADTHNPFC